MNKLTELGWSRFFQKQLDSDDAALMPGRVMREDLQGYHLMTGEGSKFAVLPGRLRKAASSKADLPTVGDWVLAEPVAHEADKVQIRRLLKRRTRFSRREAGNRLGEQVVAANIDTVFIVCGLDGDFNPGRIERYLLLAFDSGATPVVILSKADLSDDLEGQLDQVRDIASGVGIHVVSALEGKGLEMLGAYLEPGKTIALLGSSGVGKSTIINVLLGEEYFLVNEVREGDSRGRHTTTHRELVVLPGGGVIMDTPGMREIQLWTDESALGSSFEDIEALARECKFTDCSHESEPNCAVREAVRTESLDQDRLDSYQKLSRELQHLAEEQEIQARLRRKTRMKKFSRMTRKRPTKKDRQ